jgi:hypothetical protein
LACIRIDNSSIRRSFWHADLEGTEESNSFVFGDFLGLGYVGFLV